VRARPRRGALGLRGRIVGVVVVCTVATLGVAAIALLGPLENSLRKAARTTLQHEMRIARRTFRHLSFDRIALFAPPGGVPAALASEYAAGARQRKALISAEQALDAQIGATASVWGYVDPSGQSRPLLPPAARPDAGATGSDDDGNTTMPGTLRVVAAASRSGAPVYDFHSSGGTEFIDAAAPLQDGRYLVVRKPINDIPDAVHAVRQAFLYAVLAGLVLSLLLGISLAARLVRRLRELRVSALQIADGGAGPAVPEDRGRDEIGDLARSFATMQRRLAHQEEARRAFVATASHELRTPLTSLEGMLELLDDDLRGGDPDLDDARSLLASARAQSRRLARLAADLLDLSRIDAEVELRSEPIELAELCRAVLAEFELGTRARGVRTALEESRSAIWALGDPGSVARILRILLDNAVRVSAPGSEVTVGLAHAPRPTLSVRDRGPGVQEAEREVIFERFHRGQATGGDAGFGLGLAIGRELAVRMGGSLGLDPADGPGARFTLTLAPAPVPEGESVPALTLSPRSGAAN
jgi:signal transduction histidine kinase